MSKVDKNDQAPKDKVVILQYNQIRGVKKGHKPKWSLNYDHYTMQCGNQKAVQASKDYLVAYVNPKTKQITWKDAITMQVKPKLPQDKISLATAQTWDINYKKKLVEEFGTSKSKRKINQMLSNVIN